MAKNANGRASRSESAGLANASAWSARVHKVESELESIDRGTLTAAMEKRNAGKPLLKRERAALDRHRKLRDEQAFWRFARHMPKIVYQAMCGRSTNVLHAQARKLGFPLTGETLDLPMVLSAFHQWFADNKNRILAPDSEEGMLAGDNSPGLERYRLAKAALTEMELAKQRGEIVATNAVRGFCAIIGERLRRMAEKFQEKGFQEAFRLYEQAIDDVERITDRMIYDVPAELLDPPPKSREVVDAAVSRKFDEWNDAASSTAAGQMSEVVEAPRRTASGGE